MKRAILLIIAVVFFIVMVSLRMAGAEESCVKLWKHYDENIDEQKLTNTLLYFHPPDCPRPEKPKPSCAEQWKAYDKWRSSSKSPICDKLEKGQPKWDCLNERERELKPDCPRPVKKKGARFKEIKEFKLDLKKVNRLDPEWEFLFPPKQGWAIVIWREVCEEGGP